MKRIILASLFLIPQVHGACSYNVDPIRTFFQTLDATPSYEGTRIQRELQPDGSYMTKSMEGGWAVQEISPDHWRFAGEFCDGSFCEDSEMHFSISDGCLRSGPDGSNILNVSVGTARQLHFSDDRDGVNFQSKFTHTPSPNTLRIIDKAYRGKKLIFSSRFKGRPVSLK